MRVRPQERASFRILDSLFELEATPLDERVSIIDGAGNGYGVVNVGELAPIRDKHNPRHGRRRDRITPEEKIYREARSR